MALALILVVEDDGLAARYVTRSLRGAGHITIQAREARAALLESQHSPDLILLDLGLPDLPGEKLLQRLKGNPHTACIPVLVITGKAEAAARLWRSERHDLAGVLVKPVSAAALRQAVSRALRVGPWKKQMSGASRSSGGGSSSDV